MIIGAKRIVSFFCGSALAVLAIVGAVSESSLLHVLILGQPLIFWGVVGTVVYSVSKGETRKQYDDFNVNEVKEELLRKGGEKIRYYPEWWKNRAGEVQVKKEVRSEEELRGAKRRYVARMCMQKLCLHERINEATQL